MPTAPLHAIVIGAGMGGLLAARVLADVCAKVTIVEIVERGRLAECHSAAQGSPAGGGYAQGLLAGGFLEATAAAPARDKSGYGDSHSDASLRRR